MANLGIKKLNEIVKKTLNVIDDSKGAIFDILENARKEVSQLKDELQVLKAEANRIMSQYKTLEGKLAQSKKYLASINSDLANSQEQMEAAYKTANDILVEIAVCRESERQTILRRNDVERRLQNALETVAKAEKLVTQVGTVFDYLSGDLSSLDEHFEKTESKRLLALRIIKTQENERRRIAREIHDGPAQAMSNVVIMTEICEKTAELDMGKALIELQKLKAVVRDCLKSVRRIIYDLRPMSIDDLGFTPTIQKYIEKFSAEHNIRVDFKVNSEEDCIKDSNIALAVFRIVQESLNNTYKHADATHVSIQVECAQNSVLLRISDDGNGFDTNILSNSLNKEDSRFGILGMRERVELLEGEFIIDSKINVGTIIRVKLPYSLQEET